MVISDLPAPMAAAAFAYLDAVPIEAPTIRKRKKVSGRLRSDLRLMDLFDDWKMVMLPTLQTAHEYQAAARDFVDFLGDIPVEEMEQNDLLNYRDEARNLPATMPKADRALPFTERLDRDRHSEADRVSPSTLKKRIGGVQALLSFAKGQKWISRNEGRDVAIVGYTKGGHQAHLLNSLGIRQVDAVITKEQTPLERVREIGAALGVQIRQQQPTQLQRANRALERPVLPPGHSRHQERLAALFLKDTPKNNHAVPRLAPAQALVDAALAESRERGDSARATGAAEPEDWIGSVNLVIGAPVLP